MALESLVHPAALFLAEFVMLVSKRNDRSRGAAHHRHGDLNSIRQSKSARAAYAAAAASLFRPLGEELDWSGCNSHRSVMERPTSSDNSDDEDGPAGNPSPHEQKEGMEMDDGESDGAPPELLVTLGRCM
jgi:hypothetical protein